jgi:hypothetical protein
VLGLSEVAALLQGTPLAMLPVGDGPSGALVVSGIDPARLHDAWRAAFALLPVTGRWPSWSLMIPPNCGTTSTSPAWTGTPAHWTRGRTSSGWPSRLSNGVCAALNGTLMERSHGVDLVAE